MRIPTISIEKHWSIESVRKTCIRFEWYTRGTVEEYNDMLEDVRLNQPTAEALWVIADNILRHSDTESSVTDIMGHLEKYAVTTIYKASGDE